MPYTIGGPLRRLATALVAVVVISLSASSSAYALEYGLVAADNSTQEAKQWEIMQHSGATVYHWGIGQDDYLSEGKKWGKLDTVIRLGAEHGFTMLPYLYKFGGGTGGSQHFPTKTVYTETGPESWDAWVESVVRRYGYNGTFWSENPSVPYRPVQAWEVWNEPNLAANNPVLTEKQCKEIGQSFNAAAKTCVQPANYGEFLKHTVPVIRSAQEAQSPGTATIVLFGGLNSSPGTGGTKPGQYLEEVHNTVSEISFNDLSLHPYALLETEKERQKGFETRVNEAREKLNLFGKTKALWITELGWPVAAKSGGVYVTEEEQKNLLNSSFDWVQSHEVSSNIKLLTWFDYRDTSGFGNWADSTGLREKAPTSKFRKSWYAYLSQTGQPSWVPAPEGASWWTYWANGYSASYADVTGDGKADLIGRFGEDIEVAPSTGTSFKNTGTWINWANSYSASYADVNGDGKADLIGRSGENIQVALSTGSGFAPGVTWGSWANGYSASYADVNGDGKADLIGRFGETIAVSLSTGKGFSGGVNWANWSNAYSASYADVNGDGKVDLVGRWGTNVQYALSTGSGFENGVNWFNEWTTEYSADYADVTGDKKADAIGRYETDVEVAP